MNSGAFILFWTLTFGLWCRHNNQHWDHLRSVITISFQASCNAVQFVVIKAKQSSHGIMWWSIWHMHEWKKRNQIYLLDLCGDRGSHFPHHVSFLWFMCCYVGVQRDYHSPPAGQSDLMLLLLIKCTCMTRKANLCASRDYLSARTEFWGKALLKKIMLKLI